MAVLGSDLPRLLAGFPLSLRLPSFALALYVDLYVCMLLLFHLGPSHPGVVLAVFISVRLMALGYLALYFGLHLRTQLHVRSLRRRVEMRSLRWCRKHARRLSRMKVPKGHCWLALFMSEDDPPLIPAQVAMASGPLLTPAEFRTLLRLYGSWSVQSVTMTLAFVRDSHVCVRATVYDKDRPFFLPSCKHFGVNAQSVIDTAVAVGAAQFGAPKAGEMFASALKGSITVTTGLTQQQRTKVESMCPHPLLFTNKSSTVTDHAELRAAREIARTMFERLYQVQNSSKSTLCVGAGRHETIYLANKSIDHYYHMSEGKDYERVTSWMLEDIGRYMNNKAKKHSKLRLKAADSKLALEIKGLEEVIRVFKEVGELPQGFLTSLDGSKKYESLVFCDSLYNFGALELEEIFRKTDAKVAYCMSILPFELIFPDMPQNDLYRYSYDPISGLASMTYGAGAYANGYSHNRDKWALPLSRPVLNCGSFSLVFEIDARIGPMTVFKIVKTESRGMERIVRNLSLPKNLRFVRVMDPFLSCKPNGVISPKYFSVYADEWWETVNYALSLDPKSLSYANLMAFVRRRGGGISLVNKELLAPWNVRQSQYSPFCMAVFLYVRREQIRAAEIEGMDVFSVDSSLSSRLKTLASQYNPIAMIERYLFDTELMDQIVIFPVDEARQADYIKVLKTPGTPTHRISVGVDNVEHAECEICAKFVPKRGKQVVKCEPGKSLVHYGLTTEQLSKLRMSFANNDNDPGDRLAKLKDQARAVTPITTFESDIEMHYVLGGPGCGKSYLIRALASRLDGVALPFVKLVADYENLEDEDGNRYNLSAKTFHRAIRDLRGIECLFIDEFTALPWEVIQVIIYLSGCQKVYIVGDTKQTKVQPSEGMYIGDFVDIDSLPRHTLMRNFRNPRDTVALLNRAFDYDMQAMSEIGQSIFTYPPGKRPSDMGEQFAFSHATCQALNLKDDDSGKDRTVRTYQGSTVSGALTLHIQQDDEPLLTSDELTIVALSRHKTRLNICHNDSQAVKDWFDRLGLPYHREEVATEENEWVNLPEEHRTHEQKDHPMPVDDEVLGAIFQDHVPESHSVPRARFQVTTRTLLSVTGLVLKFLTGTSFVSKSWMSWYSVFKFLYFNRIFMLERTETWTAYLESLPVAMLKSYIITYWTKALFYPLRVYLPRLATFIPRHRPAAHACPIEYELVDGVLQNLGLPRVACKISSQLSTFGLDLAKLIHRSIGDTAWDILACLSPYADWVEDIFDIIETYPAQLLAGVFFRLRQSAQEDVLFTVPLPSHTDADKFHDLINGVATSEKFNKFVDWATMYIPGSIRKWSIVRYVKESKIPIPSNISPKDAYLFARDCMPAWSSVALGLPYPNILASVVIPPVFRTGTMNPADFMRPTNARGHPQAPAPKKYTFGMKAGQQYTGRQPFQVLQVLAGRYFNKKPASKMFKDPLKAKSVVQSIMHDAKLELLNPIEGWDMDSLDILADEFFKTAAAKNYEKQFQGMDSPEGRNIRFHLKNIFKPALSDQKPMNVFKVGQGIAAWGKDAQIMFGLASKWINFVLLKSLKKNVVYDNRLTPEQMRNHLKEHWANVPEASKNGVTDFTMYDSQQDDFSQLLEQEFLSLLGVSQEFIDHYFSFRKNGKLLTAGVSGRLGTEKTSGEPMTLLGNSVISMLLANWLLRGDGPSVMAVKGDDGFKRQANMELNKSRLQMLSEVCRLEIKAYVEDTAEFCGFAIGARSFAPSIPRKLCKALGHEFVDYAHYSEYRKSILDWLADLDRQDINDIIATNTTLFNLSVEECQSMLGVIRSLAHLGEKEFYELAEEIGDPEVLQAPGPSATF